MTKDRFDRDVAMGWDIAEKDMDRRRSLQREKEERARAMEELNKLVGAQHCLNQQAIAGGGIPGMSVGGYPLGLPMTATRTIVAGGTGAASGLPQAMPGGFLILENPEALNLPRQVEMAPIQEPEEEPRPTLAADEFSFIRRRQEELARQTMERVAKCDD